LKSKSKLGDGMEEYELTIDEHIVFGFPQMIEGALFFIGLYFPYHCNIFFIPIVSWMNLVF